MKTVTILSNAINTQDISLEDILNVKRNSAGSGNV